MCAVQACLGPSIWECFQLKWVLSPPISWLTLLTYYVTSSALLRKYYINEPPPFVQKNLLHKKNAASTYVVSKTTLLSRVLIFSMLKIIQKKFRWLLPAIIFYHMKNTPKAKGFFFKFFFHKIWKAAKHRFWRFGKNGGLPEGHLHKYWRRQNGHGQAIETVYELFSAIYICYILYSKMWKKTWKSAKNDIT